MLDDLETNHYRTIVVDPPWNSGGYIGGGRPGGLLHKEFDFPTMSVEQIQAIPIGNIARGDAFVFLWTVNGKLRPAFDVLDAWRVRYVFQMVWHKPAGPRPVGFPGYNGEFVLVGKIGRPKFVTTKGFFTVSRWDPGCPPDSPGARRRRARACEKPEGFYELLRRVAPCPRVDIFARRRIMGFDAWGDEAPKNFS